MSQAQGTSGLISISREVGDSQSRSLLERIVPARSLLPRDSLGRFAESWAPGCSLLEAGRM